MRVITITILLLSFYGKAQQTNLDVNFIRFSDFHIHTGFKHFYRDFASADEIINHRTDVAYLKKLFGQLNWEQYTKNQADKNNGRVSHVMNYDQSNYYNLRNLPGSILCTSVYPYEKQFAVSFPKRFISHQFVTHIPLDRLGDIGSRHSYPLKEFLAQYIYLTMQDITDPHGTLKIELAKDGTDLRRILSDPNSIAQVLTIEGGHVLYGPKAGAKENVRRAFVTGDARAEIMSNIDTLRRLPHKIFFVTLAHFTDNMIAGYSKTLDRSDEGTRRLLKGLSLSVLLRKSLFTKFGEGIHGELDYGSYIRCDCKKDYGVSNVRMPYTEKSYSSDLGREIILKLLQPDDGVSKRILIDVKHLDIKARFEYYNLVKELNKTSRKPIPIIAGHTNISGESLPVAMATGLNPLFDKYQEIENPLKCYTEQLQKYNSDWLCRTRYLKSADKAMFFSDPSQVQPEFNPFALQGINSTTAGWFYPWSLNICDEEIKIIYESNGIIGLNFDERLLGSGMINYSTAYKNLTRKKFDSLLATNFHNGLLNTLKFEDYYKCEPLIRNILYIVGRCGKDDPTSWDHIAIGSDFDGLIDPIDLCPSAEKIPAFHRQLVVYLEAFWQIHKHDVLFQKKDLFFGGSVSYLDAMNKFFYENGRRFILDNF